MCVGGSIPVTTHMHLLNPNNDDILSSSGKFKSLTNSALSYFLVYVMTSHNALVQLHLP